MIPQGVRRRLGPWLIGLFLIAQTCGVVQILGEHTAHLAETHMILPATAITGGASHHHHHNGDADGAIQHHELQDLNGTIVCLMGGCELALRQIALTARVPDALVENNPVLLDHPPKPFLSV